MDVLRLKRYGTGIYAGDGPGRHGTSNSRKVDGRDPIVMMFQMISGYRRGPGSGAIDLAAGDASVRIGRRLQPEWAVQG